MSDLLDYSARIIDESRYEGPGSVNRPSGRLSEVGDGIAVVEAFSHVVAFRTGEGLLLFDTSLEQFGPGVRQSLRAWCDDPIHSVAYTHGHVDHVGGMQGLLDEAEERGRPRPRVIAHENVSPRFERYQLTSGYNAAINARQFGGTRGLVSPGGALEGLTRFGPRTWVHPDTTFRDRARVRVGELEVELRHHLGETDDHLWAWIPERRAICAGDFVLWVFPNAGNPQKVQRYPLEWSRALREMAALAPELLLPAHGLPVGGAARVRQLLDDSARALELVVEHTLTAMNQGARLDDIVHSLELPDELMQRPYLRPTYDEPEFVVHNVWRLYGGWWDGDPAHLKPAPARALASELASLAGGAETLALRALALADHGELRLACQLVELAAQAEPEEREVHAARARVYELRRESELSLMAKGVYRHAAQESRRLLGEE